MRVCQGGAGSIAIYSDVTVLAQYKALVLAQHPDGQTGIYLDAGTDVLGASAYNFGEIPGNPPREVKVTNETEARAKWEQLVNELRLQDAEAEQREARAKAVQKARESAAAIRDMKIKRVINEKHQAIEYLKQHIAKPGVDLFSKKTSELADQVQRCEIILKHL